MSDGSPVEILPKVYTNKASGIPSMDAMPLGIPPFPEVLAKPVELEGEVREELATMVLFQLNWIKNNLGLDVSKRFIDGEVSRESALAAIDKNVTVYDATGWEEYKRVHQLNEKTRANVDVATGQIALGDENAIVPGFVHELNHILSGIVIQVAREQVDLKEGYFGERLIAQGIPLSGLVSNKFSELDEMVTETLSLEMLNDYKKDSGKDYVSGGIINYHTQIILFDLITRSGAERMGIDPQEVRHRMYKAYFKSDYSVLRTFSDLFGKDAVKELANLSANTDSDIAKMGAFCKLFGFDRHVWLRLVEEIELGKPIPFLRKFSLQGRILD